MEPKPSTQYETREERRPPGRAVEVVLSADWAQALTHLQQLHNQGRTLVRLIEDERGRVRVEPVD